MREREAFLKALEQNEDDEVTRLIFADWLDDNGEHEEADRMRKWKAAKAWLVQFCKDNNPDEDEKYPHEVDLTDENLDVDDLDMDDYGEVSIEYDDLLGLARTAVDGADAKGSINMNCWNNMGMMDALQQNSAEFWKNFAIVTGVPLPPDIGEKCSFRCSC